MKGSFTLFSLFFFLITSSFPQVNQTWKWIHEKPQGNQLRWVKVWDNNNWYAAGLGGTFMKTSDAGNTWFITHRAGHLEPAGTYTGIYRAHFKNIDSGLVAGDNGVQYTTDGGNTFHPIPNALPLAQTYYSIYMLNDLVGYITGLRLHKTTDGGMSWSQIPVAESIYYDVTTLDDTLIMACGLYGNILRSTDGGSTFSGVATGSSVTLYKIKQKSQSVAYVSGTSGSIRMTIDGGASWSSINAGLPTNVTFFDIDVKGDTLFVTGDPFNIYMTTDNGGTWTPISFIGAGGTQRLTNYYYSTDFLSDRFVTVGPYGLINQKIADNPSVVFTDVTKTGNINDVWSHAQTGRVITVGAPSSPGITFDQVMLSTNGGENWTVANLSYQSRSTFRSVDMIDSLEGYAVGTLAAVYRTRTGGASWDSLVTSIPSQVTLYDVDFINDSTGWVFGSSGQVFKTTDGGETWTSQISGLSGIIYTGSMVNSESGWCAGQNGAIVYTTNGGSNWNPQVSNFGTSAIYNVKALSGEVAWISGAGNKIAKTTDAGLTWNIIPGVASWGTSVLYAMDFADPDNGIIGSNLGKLAVTTDGGASWTMEYTGSNTINSIKIGEGQTNQRGAFLVSVNGMVLKKSDYVIPVELAVLTAAAVSNGIELKWMTSSETNNRGFEIERSSAGGEWQKIAFVAGNGTTTNEKNYSYTDNVTTSGKYSYHLKQIDFNGEYRYSDIVAADYDAPREYALYQNYPNPFNPSTTISFSIFKEGMVNISIFNALGEKKSELLKNQFMTAGRHNLTFDASGFPSGIYFYKITAGSFTQTMKMLLIK